MAIADVSDKGLAAALYMTVARTLIRAYAQNARSPSTVLQRANHPLVADTPAQHVCDRRVCHALDPETGEIEYANAGHNRPLLLRVKDQTIEELPKGGMAMGVMARHQLTDHHLTLEPGDCLLLYTDGVTETFSAGRRSIRRRTPEKYPAGLFWHECGRSAQTTLKPTWSNSAATPRPAMI